MKERPILFSGPMVRAILEGRKTQTRRVVKGLPDGHERYPKQVANALGCVINGATTENCHFSLFGSAEAASVYGKTSKLKCPFGKPGDLLWVRETYTLTNHGTPVYRADAKDSRGDRWTSITPGDPNKEVIWRPSIHMPRWASRLTLRITDVRVERLQDISEEDARAEGAYPIQVSGTAGYDDGHKCVIAGFERIWDGINGKTHPWGSNPWVWVLEFERVEVPD